MCHRGKVLVLSNHPTWTHRLRGEVLEALIAEGYRVIVAVGYGPEVEWLKAMGCEHVDVPYNRRSVNLLKEVKLFLAYRKLIQRVKPDVVLTYTIKPNLYGAYLCGRAGIPCLVNITGLGSALEKQGFWRRFFLAVYQVAFKRVKMVFFQNTANMDLFVNHSIVKDNYVLIPGSGVNLQKYLPLPYPSEETIDFVFISRILKAKGIEDYLGAAEYIRGKYPQTRFYICGFCDQDYMEQINRATERGVVIYHGMVEDMQEIYRATHCTVLPSWYPEGMNNVLLESAASARPIITTDRPGCGEIIDDGVNGYIVRPHDTQDLIDKLERFILLPHKKKADMGLAGRRKVERQFDRRTVVDAYLKAVNEAIT